MSEENEEDEIQYDGRTLGFEIWGDIEIMSALEVIAKGRRMIDYMNASNSPEGLRIIERITGIHMDIDAVHQSFIMQKQQNPELFETLENDVQEFSATELVEIARSVGTVTSFSSVSDRLDGAQTAQEQLNILADDDTYDALEKEIDEIAIANAQETEEDMA